MSGCSWQVSQRQGIDSVNISCSYVDDHVCCQYWRTGTTDDADRGPMTPEAAFAFRIIVTIVLSLGFIYFVLIASTLRRCGGEMIDRAWHRWIVGWINGSTKGSGHRRRLSHFQYPHPLLLTAFTGSNT